MLVNDWNFIYLFFIELQYFFALKTTFKDLTLNPAPKQNRSAQYDFHQKESLF